ncbi:MAG: tetratricopeptide repeat protein [Gemmatimonadaceae bacterium]
MTTSPSNVVKRWTVGASVVVALVTLVSFLPVLSAGFVTWDDDANFLNNASYRGLGSAQLHWMWTTFHLGHYVPLSWMTLGLDYVVWGMNPFGYHLTNLVLHAANAVVVYWIARRLLRRAGAIVDDERGLALGAAFAALAFAVHPLRVESVAWITERRDVLSGLLSSLTALTYLKSTDGNARSSRWYWLAVAVFAAAALSKGTVVTLPAILVILNAYPLGRLGGTAGWNTPIAKRVYREMAPFVAIAGAAAVMAFFALQRVDQLPLSQKTAVSAYSLAFYVMKTIVPSGLAPLYKMPSQIDPASARFVASYVAAIGLTAVAWFVRRRWRASWVGWLAFVIVLLPMLGIHQNGPQIAADRYTYHASPVIGILAAAWIATVLTPTGIQSLAVSSAVVLILGTLTWRQSEIWHDSERMWTRVVDVDSTSSVAQTALANLLLARGDLASAVSHYRQSLSIDPASPEAHDNLGVALSRQGSLPEAIEQFRETLRFRPNDYEAENDLGVALAHTGDLASAVEHYQRALAIKPAFADAHVNWGNALVKLNNLPDAITHYVEAVRIAPSNANAERNWGVALAQQGEMADAVRHFQRALNINANDEDAKAYLAQATTALLKRRIRQ